MNKLYLFFVAVVVLFFVGDMELSKNLQTNIQTPVQYIFGSYSLAQVEKSHDWISTDDLNSIPKKSSVMWERITLPSDLSTDDAGIFVSEIYENYRVYENGTEIYHFGNMHTFSG